MYFEYSYLARFHLQPDYEFRPGSIARIQLGRALEQLSVSRSLAKCFRPEVARGRLRRDIYAIILYIRVFAAETAGNPDTQITFLRSDPSTVPLPLVDFPRSLSSAFPRLHPLPCPSSVRSKDLTTQRRA